tara:strand:+ start:3899 stop:6502 length:2604 start_codon:yes stop_codon:yes gene_type:complete
MPKIRNKQVGNTSKSGNLNQNFRKVLKDDQHLNNFVLRDNFHISKETLTDEVKYNDNDTIMFVEKSVNATLGIEKKYFLQETGFYSPSTISLNNRILHTPNSFGQIDDVSFNINKIPEDIDYKNLIYANYRNELDNDFYEVYKEDFTLSETFSSQNEEDLIQYQSEFDKIIYNFKKREYQIKKDYEEIEIKFNSLGKKALSFNLNNSTFDNNNNITNYRLNGPIPYVKYPNPGNWHDGEGESCFLAANINTIYLKDGIYDYSLGTIDSNKFSTITALLERGCITHNPLTFYDNDVIGNSGKVLGGKGISNPISNCGFPFDVIYRGKEEVTVPLKSFITSDFILEKVYVEFGIQNFSISNNSNIPCFNTLNFFILNQRGDINDTNQYNSFWVNSDYIQSTHYNENTSSLETITAPRNKDNAQTRSQSNITNTLFRSPFKEIEVQNNFSPSIFPNKTAGYNQEGSLYNYENLFYTDVKQREIVTSIKIANVGQNIQENPVYFSSLDAFDKVLYTDLKKTDFPEGWDGNTINDICIHNDFKTVKILSNVKSYKENKNLKRFSKFEIYPKQRKNRAGLPFTSEKSYNTENQFATEDFFNDERGAPFDLGYEDNYVESPYVLNPKDSLIFGFNFAPNMNLSLENLSSTNKYNNITGRDVLVLDLSGIKIKLIGRYVANKKLINIKNNVYENKNIKKINEYAINVTDKFGLPLPYMLKGTYYDNYGGVYWPKGISNGKRSFAYNINIPIDPEFERPYGWEPSFGWTISKFKEESRTEFRQLDDIATPQYQPKKYLYYRFSVDHFGFLSDKFNENKHYAYINVQTGEIIRNIKKIFRKNGFLKEKVLNTDTFNSYNTDRHASLDSNNICFKEIP